MSDLVIETCPSRNPEVGAEVCNIANRGSKEKIHRAYEAVEKAYKAYEEAMCNLQCAFEEELGKALILVGNETIKPLDDIAKQYGVDVSWTLDKDLDKL